MERKSAVKTKRDPRDYPAVDSVFSDDVNKTNDDMPHLCSESVAELLEFYASIPDYGEVHHLSDTEFYQRLHVLREKRKHYTSQGSQTPDCKINDNSTEQRNTIRKPTSSFKRKNNFGLAVKKCEIHTKGTDPFRDADGSKFSRNRNMFFDDIEFRTDRFIPTPETFSVLSSDAGQPLGKVGVAKHVRKPITAKSKELVKQPELFRVESCSSVAPSEKLTAEYCGKFECLSDSDSAPPLSYPLFRGSKILKRKMNRPKTAIPTSLPISSREKKLWTPDLSESKFDSKSGCSERNEEKSGICQSAPDLRSSPSTFKARPVPKYIFSSRNNHKTQATEAYRSLQRKIRAEKLLNSSSLPPSMAAREKYIRPTSSNFQGDCGSRHTESDCSSAKEGKCSNTAVVKLNCKGGNCDNKDSTARGCPSSGIPSTSSNESFPAMFRMRMRSCPESVVIPSKNNLAAILRIQSTRQKMERDLEDKLAELKRKEDACIKAHLARQQPSWQAIQYSTEEDLALRRILRKEKEKRHLRDHQQQMNLMLARVQQIPPLFERQTARRSRRAENNVH